MHTTHGGLTSPPPGSDRDEVCPRTMTTKRTDDYHAKFHFWAEHPRVVALPVPGALPRFGHKRFSSYEEMNTWKREYRLEIARRGGLTWTH